MSDNRIKDLVLEIDKTKLEAKLAEIYLVGDAASFTDAEKLALSTLLTSEAIISNANNYQAITPKAFYDSAATEEVKGVIQIASSAEITSKSTDKAILSSKQATMQGQWKKDWFYGEGPPKSFRTDNEDTTLSSAMQFTSLWQGDIAANQFVNLTPGLSPSVKFRSIYATIIVNRSDDNAYTGSHAVNAPTQSGQVTSVHIGGGIYLQMTNLGQLIGIWAGSAISNVRVSMSVNAVMQ